MLTNRINFKARRTPLFVFWDGAFTNGELNKIEKDHASDEEKKYLHFLPDQIIEETARSTNQWMFQRLNKVLDLINDEFFHFDLYGYENYNYTELTDKVTPQWHVPFKYNEESETEDPVKLWCELQLNSNDKFEGGRLLYNLSGEDDPFKCDNVRGRLLVSPAWLLMGREPVTEGTKKIIEFGIHGPRFK